MGTTKTTMTVGIKYIGSLLSSIKDDEIIEVQFVKTNLTKMNKNVRKQFAKKLYTAFTSLTINSLNDEKQTEDLLDKTLITTLNTFKVSRTGYLIKDQAAQDLYKKSSSILMKDLNGNIKSFKLTNVRTLTIDNIEYVVEGYN